METWYEDRGEGEPLVLLHPGMADARAFFLTTDPVLQMAPIRRA